MRISNTTATAMMVPIGEDLSIYLYIYLSIYISIYLYICLSIHLSIYLYIYLIISEDFQHRRHRYDGVLYVLIHWCFMVKLKCFFLSNSSDG